jgi:ubiquitin-protein ligase
MPGKRKLPLANPPVRRSQRRNKEVQGPCPNQLPSLLRLPLEILFLLLDFTLVVKGQWGTSTFVADFSVLARVCHPLLALTKDQKFLDSLYQRGLYFIKPLGEFERIIRWKMGMLIQESVFSIAAGAPSWGNVCRTNNIYVWTGVLTVPLPSPFASAGVAVNIHFGPQFPFKPLVVEFEERVFHPNVNKRGKLCLPILRDFWNPSCCLSSLLWHIITILGMPYVPDKYLIPNFVPDDYSTPNSAMKLYLQCPKLYHQRAQYLYDKKKTETVLPVPPTQNRSTMSSREMKQLE